LSDIEQDIRTWSEKFLSVPNKHFNGIAPCPYARKAFLDDQVLFTVNTGIDGLLRAVNQYNDHDKDIVIWAEEHPPAMEYLDGFCDGINEVLSMLGKDMHLMVFHPDYDISDVGLDFLDDGGVTDPNLSYAMVFVQKLSLLDDASLQLEKKDYYINFPQDIFESLVLDRRRLRHEGQS
jgi:hypothetical protein